MSGTRPGDPGADDPGRDESRDADPAADDPAADDRTVAADDLDEVLGRFGDDPADDRTVAADGVAAPADDPADPAAGGFEGTDAELEAVLERYGDEPADDRTVAAGGAIVGGHADAGVPEPVEDRTEPDDTSAWSPPAEPATGARDDATAAPGGTAWTTSSDDSWKPAAAEPVPPAPGGAHPSGDVAGSGRVSSAGEVPAPGEAVGPGGTAPAGEPGREPAAEPVVPPAPTVGDESERSDTTMPPAPGFDPGSAEQRWRPPARTRQVIEPESTSSWPVWLIPIVVVLAIASIVAIFLLS